MLYLLYNSTCQQNIFFLWHEESISFRSYQFFIFAISNETQLFSLSLIKTISISYIVIYYIQYKIWKEKMYTIKKSMNPIGLCSCSKPILLENFRPYCIMIFRAFFFSGLWFLSFGFVIFSTLALLFISSQRHVDGLSCGNNTCKENSLNLFFL